MRIYIMTDLEGVAGVLNFSEWCTPESRYYETAKELLTREVNAAADGFFAGGATDIVVSDGHGAGGINPLILDERVELMRGYPTVWPLLLDNGYDALAFVGQHAKAGTELAHLSRTQDWSYLDLSINGISVGEMGQLALCAGELGVRVIFCSGDQALCQEARALLPGVETVAVKRGTTPGRGDELDAESYSRCNTSAVHLHPQRARAAIRVGAEQAMRRVKGERFGLLQVAAPYVQVLRLRPSGAQPAATSRTSHPSSVSALLNLPFDLQPLG
jgi:D-amino peptidase